MAIEKLMCFLIALPSKVEKVITQNVHSLMEIKCLLSLQGFLGKVVAALFPAPNHHLPLAKWPKFCYFNFKCHGLEDPHSQLTTLL